MKKRKIKLRVKNAKKTTLTRATRKMRRRVRIRAAKTKLMVRIKRTNRTKKTTLNRKKKLYLPLKSTSTYPIPRKTTNGGCLAKNMKKS